MKKATHQQTKNHNTRLVLRTLFQRSNISRADIARATGLTRPTVSAIIAGLMDADLVVEKGLGPSAGGKPPIMLDVNANAHHIISVDLGSQNFRAALVNLRGKIVRQVDRFNNGRRGEDALTLTIEMVDELIATSATPVIGMGIGAPGVTDPGAGVIRSAVNLGWVELPIRERFEQRYNLPIHIANDCHAAALAEYTFGGPRDSNNLILVKVSQGIGAGVILNGRPFYGDGFGAGEIGHLVVNPAGEHCRCGNSGCLETIASTRSIVRRAQGMAATHPLSMLGGHRSADRPVVWDDVVRAFRAGDDETSELVAETGHYLGIALASLIASLNVRHIVISGRIVQLGQRLLDAACTEARRCAYPNMVKETDIRFSPLGPEIVLLGASALVLKEELGVI